MYFVKVSLFLALLVFLEVLLIPLPLAFIALFIWLLFYDEGEALCLAFITGSLFDVLLLKTLGTTSLLFLVLLFVTVLYKKKYAPDNLIFLAIAAFVSVLILEFTLQHHVVLAPSLVSSMLVVFFAKRFFARSKYESWYRLS